MGGLTNGIGYVAAALTVGWLLKSTDYISYKIDERCLSLTKLQYRYVCA